MVNAVNSDNLGCSQFRVFLLFRIYQWYASSPFRSILLLTFFYSSCASFASDCIAVLQTTASQSGLFDHLINVWEFKPGPTPGTCDLYFLVDFKFQSPLYRQVKLVCY
jgi:hypothetical protein